MKNLENPIKGFLDTRSIGIIFCVLLIVCGATTVSAQHKQIVIAASTVLDGKGGVLHDTRIVIEGSKIVRIDPNAGPIAYDLRGLTVLPGWIDAHVHITWVFGPDGKNAGAGATTPQASYAAAANASPSRFAGHRTGAGLPPAARRDRGDPGPL